MLTLFALGSLLFFIPHGETASMRCLLGEGIVCGSDGFTYYNKCDFNSVKSSDPTLFIKHMGPCDNGSFVINPYVAAFNVIENYKRLGLRQRYPKMSSFSRLLLTQMINSQTQLGGFDFHHNTINTQGNQNSFEIKVGRRRY